MGNTESLSAPHVLTPIWAETASINEPLGKCRCVGPVDRAGSERGSSEGAEMSQASFGGCLFFSLSNSNHVSEHSSSGEEGKWSQRETVSLFALFFVVE